MSGARTNKAPAISKEEPNSRGILNGELTKSVTLAANKHKEKDQSQ